MATPLVELRALLLVPLAQSLAIVLVEHSAVFFLAMTPTSSLLSSYVARGRRSLHFDRPRISSLMLVQV